VTPNPSLKLSPNGVAHWACGAGASPQFCAAVPARHTVGPTLARTLGIMKKIVLLGLAFAFSACAVSPPYPWVYYWSTDVSPPAGVQVDGHPCGGVVLLGLNKVPATDLPWLQADQIHKIDSTGQILRSWRVPADHYALKLDGEDLIIAHGSDPMRVLRLKPGGQLIPETQRLAPTPQHCPGPFREDFSCIPLQNESSHLIASPNVCT
jgi:hypothetical protein